MKHMARKGKTAIKKRHFGG